MLMLVGYVVDHDGDNFYAEVEPSNSGPQLTFIANDLYSECEFTKMCQHCTTDEVTDQHVNIQALEPSATCSTDALTSKANG